MVVVIGWYCFAIAVLQCVVLLVSANDKNLTDDGYKLRRVTVWVSHPIFLLVTVLAWRTS